MKLPPTRRVAAKRASAVRDWVTFPSAGFLDVSIYQVPRDSIATYVASGTPVPVEKLPFGGLMRRKLGSKMFCGGLKHLVTEFS